MAKPAGSAAQVEEEVEEQGEEVNELENAEAEEAENAELGEGEEPNPDGSGEGEEAGEGADPDADPDSEAEGEEAVEEEAAPNPEIETLKSQIAELTKKLEGGGNKEQPKQLTEQEIAQRAEAADMSPKQFQYVNTTIAQALQAVISHFEGKLTEGRGDSFIEDFAKSSPEFKDAGAYKTGIKEFLQEIPRDKWGDPKVMKFAYNYARGLKASKAVQNANNSRERNKKIIAKSTTVKAPAGKGKKGAAKLSAEEREIARESGMSETEYAEYRDKPLGSIRLA